MKQFLLISLMTVIAGFSQAQTAPTRAANCEILAGDIASDAAMASELRDTVAASITVDLKQYNLGRLDERVRQQQAKQKLYSQYCITAPSK